MHKISRFNESFADLNYSIGVNRFYNEIVRYFTEKYRDDLNILTEYKLYEYSFPVEIGAYKFNLKFEKDKTGNMYGAEFGFYNDKNLDPDIKLYYDYGYDILEILDLNDSNMRHEITHLFDYFKNNRYLKSSTNVLNTSGDKSYYNTPEEMNAYFIQGCTDVLCLLSKYRKIVLKTYGSFKRFILMNDKGNKFYHSLNDNNKKFIDKRMMSFFSTISNHSVII